MHKRIAIMLLCIILMVALLCSCGKKEQYTEIKFFDAEETIAALNGETVVLYGYMAPIEPYKGELTYLTNIPVNTNLFQIVLAEYRTDTVALRGENLEYIPELVRVVGKVRVVSVTDIYGCQYNYQLENVEIEPVEQADVPEHIKKYYDLIGDVNCLNSTKIALEDLCNYTTYEELGWTFEELVEDPPLFHEYNAIKTKISKSRNDLGDIEAIVNETEELRKEVCMALINKDSNALKALNEKVDNLNIKLEKYTYQFVYIEHEIYNRIWSEDTTDHDHEHEHEH